MIFKCLFSVRIHLKNLKAGDVQDAQEGGRLPLTLVQRLVDSGQDPTKQALVHGLSQSLHRKISLEEEEGGVEGEGEEVKYGETERFLL